MDVRDGTPRDADGPDAGGGIGVDAVVGELVLAVLGALPDLAEGVRATALEVITGVRLLLDELETALAPDRGVDPAAALAEAAVGLVGLLAALAPSPAGAAVRSPGTG